MSLEIAPAGKNVEAQYVDMMVPLYSWGCERKVKKALANLRGIYSVNVNLLEQKVSVWGICDTYEVLSRVQRKRKEARFWDPQDNCIIQLNFTSENTLFGDHEQSLILELEIGNCKGYGFELERAEEGLCKIQLILKNSRKLREM